MIRSLHNFGGTHLEQSEECNDYVEFMSLREIEHEQQHSTPKEGQVKLGVQEVTQELSPPPVHPPAKPDPSIDAAHQKDLKSRNIKPQTSKSRKPKTKKDA